MPTICIIRVPWWCVLEVIGATHHNTETCTSHIDREYELDDTSEQLVHHSNPNHTSETIFGIGSQDTNHFQLDLLMIS